MIDTVKLNNNSFRCLIRSGYKIESNKLWDDESGRTYHNGEFKGRLVGVFPKWNLTFFPKSPIELSNLMKELDKQDINLTIYHPKTRKQETFSCYSGNYVVEIEGMVGTIQHGRVEVSLISKKRQVV